MNTDPETIRQLATHDADIKYIKEDLDRLVRSVSTMQSDMRSIKETLAEARGGWRVLMLIGGAGGALGAAVTHWVSTFLHVPK